MQSDANTESVAATTAPARSGLDRRTFLGAAAGTALAAGGLALGNVRLAQATGSPEGADWIHLSDYAVGDGVTDDTTAFQNAVNATPAGATLIGHQGATYKISGTISFPNDNVRLDLLGCTVKSAVAQAFLLSSRTGVRIMNGVLTSTVATAGTAKIQLTSCTRCSVELITASCGGGGFVTISGGQDNRVIGCSATSGGIVVTSSKDSMVFDSVVDGAPGDGIAITGATGSPVTGTVLSGNVVRNHGGIGINENAGATDATLSVASQIARNRVEAPGTGGTIGISTAGSGCLVSGNDVLDAKTAGIRSVAAGLRCVGNRVSWDSATSGVTGILVTAGTTGDQLAAVVGNEIYNAGSGIVTSGAVSGATIAENFIAEPTTAGIDTVSQASGATGPVLTANLVRVTGTQNSGATRYGVRAGAGALVVGTRINYGASSAATGVTDRAVSIGGAGISMLGNTIDGGGRSDGRVVAAADASGTGGAILASNAFINGGTVDLSGLSAPVMLGNVGGLSNLGAPSLAAGAGAGSGAPSPTLASGSDRGGVINFGSGSSPGTGAQVAATFSAPRDVVPTVVLTPENAATAALGLYVTGVSTSGFTIAAAQAPAAGQASGTYAVTFAVQRNQ